MEAQFYGANCIRLTTKKAVIVVDDNLANLGQKSITKADNIELLTTGLIKALPARLTLYAPGEYEVSDISIQGIAARGAMDEAGKFSATIFKVIAGDVRVVILGHIFPELTDEQLEAIGTVDVVFVPVGGHGYTLDAQDALKLIRKIEPKVVIPTHYADPSLKYEVPQDSLDEAIKGLAMEPKEKVTKLSLKPTDLSEITSLIVLEKI